MVDLHAHVLPGVDDGPATEEEALALARAAVEAGITRMCATPHIDHRMAVDPLGLAERRAALQARLDAEGIALRLESGGEVAAARALELSAAELDAVRLGTGRWVLLECPLHPYELAFEPAAAELPRRGFRVLLAHPERSPIFLRDPERLEPLVAAGARCSITAGALAGDFGGPPRKLALKLLERDLVHDVASDTHDAERRPPDLERGVRAAEDALRGAEGLGDWLTRAVPAAVVDGGELPPRPEANLRRPALARFLGR